VPHNPTFVGIDPNAAVCAVGQVCDLQPSVKSFLDAHAALSYLIKEKASTQLVVIEKPPPHRQRVCRMVGTLQAALRQEGIPCLIIPSTRWKKRLLHDGRATKDSVRAFVECDLGLRGKTTHENDAVCLALFASQIFVERKPLNLSKAGRPVSFSLRSQPESLTGFWPQYQQDRAPSLFVEFLRQLQEGQPLSMRNTIRNLSKPSRFHESQFWFHVQELVLAGYASVEDQEITLMAPNDSPRRSVALHAVRPNPADVIPEQLALDELRQRLFSKYTRLVQAGSYTPHFTAKDEIALRNLRRQYSDDLILDNYVHLVKSYKDLDYLTTFIHLYGDVSGCLVLDSYGEEIAVKAARTITEAVRLYGPTPLTLEMQWNRLRSLISRHEEWKRASIRFMVEEDLYFQAIDLDRQRRESHKEPLPAALLLAYIDQRLERPQPLFGIRLELLKVGFALADVPMLLGDYWPKNENDLFGSLDVPHYASSVNRTWRPYLRFSVVHDPDGDSIGVMLLSTMNESFKDILEVTLDNGGIGIEDARKQVRSLRLKHRAQDLYSQAQMRIRQRIVYV
jgi:hypothetical protein